MTQAKPTRGILRKARDEGRRKIKYLLPVYCSGSSAHLRPQVLADGGDVKKKQSKPGPLRTQKLSASMLSETPTTA